MQYFQPCTFFVRKRSKNHEGGNKDSNPFCLHGDKNSSLSEIKLLKFTRISSNNYTMFHHVFAPSYRSDGTRVFHGENSARDKLLN